jgi:ComF family protein
MKLYKELFDFFLPRRCVSCNSKLQTDEKVVCPSCLTKFEIVPDKIIQEEYYRKFGDSNLIDSFLPQFFFKQNKGFQKLIHKLKYNKRYTIGIFLGELIYTLSFDKIKNWDIDLIMPIPLYHLRKAERGYNQSFYIAKGLSKKMNISVVSNLLKRNRMTSTQTKLSLTERESNIREAIILRKSRLVDSKNILLVDDVITTGSTIREAARVLRSANSGKIFAVTAGLSYH